jgi:glycosyltransferase involved in cell wall biosynthesis
MPLESRAGRSHHANRIHFAGWRSDIPELMRAAYCLVLPSRWEGLPNVILEAMAAGLPVVSTDVEGVSDLIQDRTAGRIVSPRSQGELEQAVGALLGDRGDARRMGAAAQVYASTVFTWSATAVAYHRLYESFLYDYAGLPYHRLASKKNPKFPNS